MKKFLLLAFLTVLIISGIMEMESENKNENENNAPETAMSKINSKETEMEIDKIINSMTTEEKIGQMIMMGINGENMDDNAKFILTEYHVGGVILLDRNMKNPEQVKNLTNSLKEAADAKTTLLIATDEEGQGNARLKEYIAPPTAAKALGDSGDTQKAFDEMKAASEKLKELGFNVNFAPVADLNLTNNRFYSADPNVTANFVQAAAQGVYEGGLIPCVKHFPGLAAITSTGGSSVSNKPKIDLVSSDMYPYERLKNADFPYFIMVNHATYQTIEQKPASLSKNMLKKVLRNELNFQGVIITDDLSGAALVQYKPAERALKAVEAGADIILSCNKYEDTREMYLALLDAYNKDKLTNSRLNESVKRIIKAKMLIK